MPAPCARDEGGRLKLCGNAAWNEGGDSRYKLHIMHGVAPQDVRQHAQRKYGASVYFVQSPKGAPGYVVARKKRISMHGQRRGCPGNARDAKQWLSVGILCTNAIEAPHPPVTSPEDSNTR